MDSQDEMRFGFGKNWSEFVERHYSAERVEISRQHLLRFLGLGSLDGRSFLDVGCGSGLHSLAALHAGAACVVSFDLDSDAVETTKLLRGHAGEPPHWRVAEGSVLDRQFLSTLEPADIVYSWGVLHHTGDMWRAMSNTVELAKVGGLIYLALYDDEAHVDPPPSVWLEVKRRYNRVGWLAKRRLELWYVWTFSLRKRWWRLPKLVRQIRRYKKSRGMAYYTDVKDWLGGWPMDFAKRDDVRRWAERSGLEIVTMKTGQANAEWLFRRARAADDDR